MRLNKPQSVKRTIGAVGQICDQNNIVICSKSGGAIVRDIDETLFKWLLPRAPNQTRFERRHNIYTFDMWLPKPKGVAKGKTTTNVDGRSISARTRKPQRSAPTPMEVDMLYPVEADAYWRFLAQQPSFFGGRAGRPPAGVRKADRQIERNGGGGRGRCEWRFG